MSSLASRPSAILCMIITAACSVFAGTQPSPRPASAGIAVLGFAGVSEQVSCMVAQSLQEVCHVQTAVRAAPASLSSDDSLALASLQSQFSRDDKMRIVLFDSSRLAPKLRNRIAVAKDIIGVDVGSATNNLQQTSQPNALTRRIEKMVLREVGLRYRLKDCLNPTCVMFRHKSLAELDMKGRGFCPPCMQLFEDALVQDGIVPQSTKVEPKSSKPVTK